MASREFDIPTVTPGEPMDDEAFQAVVKAAATDATHYIDFEVAPDREAATAYYRGDPMGNEEEGRSQIVMTEVRDTVLAILPDLLKVFCGSEHAVEFLPRTALKIEEAEQATDYVNYVVMVENPGFQIFLSVFKDALIRKTGIFKWYPDYTAKITEQDYSGLTLEMLQVLSNEDDIEILSYEPEDDAGDQKSDDPEDTNTYNAEGQTYKARIRRTIDEVSFRVEAVPPEEFLIARDARDEDNASYVGHRREIYIADLVAMGYDLDEVIENAGTSTGFEMNNEALMRNPSLSQPVEAAGGDPLMRKVLYTENYIRVDRDGDGLAERRRVCTLGGHYYVLHDELWDDMVPFAVLCPDPEPHMAIGYSIADQVADLQELKTNVMRGTLDSLAQSIHPRTAVVEGSVNLDDVLNNEMGAVIRMRAPGMVQELGSTFVGQQAMPMLEYIDAIKASRTGVTAASQGLDPDVLQSTTKAAVTAVTEASAQRKEMIARIFAEGGIKRMFRGILRMVIRHQDSEKLVKLRGKFVPVDPRDWDADMSMQTNVGLGTGNNADKINMLGLMAQKQETIIMQTGPMNPMCGIPELRNTYAKIMELAGFRDVARYFKEVTPDSIQAYQQQQSQNQPPDPNQLLAQVEAQKAQTEQQTKIAEMQLKHQEAQSNDQRERMRIAGDHALKAAELEAKFHTTVKTKAMDMAAAEQQHVREQRDGMVQHLNTLQQGDQQAAQQAAMEKQRLAQEKADTDATRVAAQQHAVQMQMMKTQAQERMAAMKAGGGE